MTGRVPPTIARASASASASAPASDSKRKRESRAKHNHHSHSAAALTDKSNTDDADDDDEREKKRKWTRLLLRELYDLGYSASAATLEREARVQLRSDAMGQLQLCVEARDWDRALELIGHSSVSSSSASSATRMVHMKSQDAVREASLLLLKRKFLDLLVQNQLRSALRTLHREILPAFLLVLQQRLLCGHYVCYEDSQQCALCAWRNGERTRAMLTHKRWRCCCSAARKTTRRRVRRSRGAAPTCSRTSSSSRAQRRSSRVVHLAYVHCICVRMT